MPHSVFALEVCVRLEPQSTLPATLRGLVIQQPETLTYQQKWQLYRAAVDALLANFGSVERGCWDYFDDDVRALNDFEHWSEAVVTEVGSRQQRSGGDGSVFRTSPERFMTVTMAFLLARGTQCDLDLAARCNVPEHRLWQKDVFAQLLSGVPLLNFAAVKGDVFYVIPADERWALTPEDLADPKFHYLRQLV